MSREKELEYQIRDLAASLQSTMAIADCYLDGLIALQKKYPEDRDILEILDKGGDLAETELARSMAAAQKQNGDPNVQ